MVQPPGRDRGPPGGARRRLPARAWPSADTGRGDDCVERYVEVVETYFNSERATALLDEMTAALRPEMQRQIDRWNRPYSMEDWEDSIAELREIVAQRPEYALANLQDYFNVSQEKMDELIKKYSK